MSLIGSKDSMGGFLVRRLLPAAIIVPIVLALLRYEGQRAGLYGTEVGLVLTTTANVLIISALVLWSTRLLDRSEEERRREEESWREADEKYRRIFENVFEGIYQTSLDGRLPTANPAIALMFGYDSPK